MDKFFIDFQILSAGRAVEQDVHSLIAMDLINYSFTGTLRIAHGSKTMNLVRTQLVEAFLTIRKVLETVPLLEDAAPFGHAMGGGRTMFSIVGNQLQISHKDSRELSDEIGDHEIIGDYVSFCLDSVLELNLR